MKYLLFALSFIVVTLVQAEEKELIEKNKRNEALQSLRKTLDAWESGALSEAVDRVEEGLKIDFADEELRRDMRETRRRIFLSVDKTYRPFLETAQKALERDDTEYARQICEEILKRIPSYPPAIHCYKDSIR